MSIDPRSRGGREEVEPAIIPFPSEPVPLAYQFAYLETNGQTWTAMTRSWATDDARRCRLCSQCTADVGRMGKTAVCLQIVEGRIPEADVPLYGLSPDLGDGRRLDQRPGAVS